MHSFNGKHKNSKGHGWSRGSNITEYDCVLKYNNLIFGVKRHFQQYFSYIMATSFSGGRSRSKPPTMGKQLVNLITCDCKSSAPFFVIYKAGCEPMPYW